LHSFTLHVPSGAREVHVNVLGEDPPSGLGENTSALGSKEMVLSLESLPHPASGISKAHVTAHARIIEATIYPLLEIEQDSADRTAPANQPAAMVHRLSSLPVPPAHSGELSCADAGRQS
jgi:hypothetical protein